MKKPTLICVVGPTAIGKTSLAISLANHFSTDILSADSRQFYKEMSIGTAAPSSQELEAAKHHFIQHKSITETYTVGAFEKDALLKLDKLYSKKDYAILVGGSGLYIDAVTKGLDTFPKIAPNIREKLNIAFKEKGIKFLQSELKEVDPTYYNKVDTQNPHRLIRALEVYKSSGEPYSSFLNQPKPERPFQTIYIGLTADRENVYDRINKRVDTMIANGLLKEVESLAPYKNHNALQTVGYRELFPFFDGKISLDEAISEIKKNTRRFAKRQYTWFNKNSEIKWFDYRTPVLEIIDAIV
ncbi:tRNA (adenosine(37)-N6)-dimethylallyltransferase MiaA [Patiriisocius hiemis]|uniref:tRNA dimethylallyltransferase n=1 Tax=Patiriisocius hiemis TaxID=3075604 RepID=A0ABU2YBX9_9FLAO|nr:tRNA (adenosine(37)-N6)-dimethylallyltransferase MiaA [Constantimarinum sp. W242]MDT0555149.1 tRNA (adenosine(37)-N6)-dimethylallyltransferase MiaA [Constantimarinum sp. W242]